MLNQVKQIIEQVSSQEINAQGIPTNLTSSVVEETGSSIISGFKNSISGGDLSQITDLFKNSGNIKSIASNSIVTSIVNNLIGSLSGKLGINEGMAKSFAGVVVPKVIGALISKSKDSKDSGLQITDLISSLSGGSNSGDLLKTLSSLGLGDSNDKNEGLGNAISSVKNLFK